MRRRRGRGGNRAQLLYGRERPRSTPSISMTACLFFTFSFFFLPPIVNRWGWIGALVLFIHWASDIPNTLPQRLCSKEGEREKTRNKTDKSTYGRKGVETASFFAVLLFRLGGVFCSKSLFYLSSIYSRVTGLS